MRYFGHINWMQLARYPSIDHTKLEHQRRQTTWKIVQNIVDQQSAALLFLCVTFWKLTYCILLSINIHEAAHFVVSVAELGIFIIKHFLFLIGYGTYLFIPGGFAWTWFSLIIWFIFTTNCRHPCQVINLPANQLVFIHIHHFAITLHGICSNFRSVTRVLNCNYNI